MKPGRRALHVLVFGTYDSKAHPRARVVMDGLQAHGFDVEECNEPLDLDTAARVELVAKPWKAPLFVARLATRWRSLWRRSRSVETPEVVLVPYLGHFDVHLARHRFPDATVVLDHLVSASDTARDRRIGGPARERLLGRLDHAALRSADVVLVDTEEHRRLLPEWAGPKGVVVPVGADDTWKVPPRPAYDGSRPLKVVFFGLFTPLQGAVTIGQAVGELADDERVQVTMVGEGQDLSAAREAAAANSRVEWVGLVPYERLPQLVADHDVCLGIFGAGPKALRVVPNKVYQGVRAGCAVVTSDTEPQRRALGDLAVYVRPGDPHALAVTLRELAADPARVAALQAAARAASGEFGPARVTEELVARISGGGGRPPSGGRPARP